MKKLAYILLMLLVLSACTSRQEYAAMRHGLDSINERNRNDEPFTVSDVQPYLEFFDRHGEPNDQMLAHYLLGRAYHEQGEAPMALQYYQQAIECADTTASDCDFAQLSRVYSQMGDLYFNHNLYHQQLFYSQLSTGYAYKGKDTLAALANYATDATAYDMLGEIDSMIFISVKAYQLFNKQGYHNFAAATIGQAVSPLIKKGETELAKKYMDIYETKSGFFDDKGNIEEGREIYYYDKGEYYLTINKLDSAIYYFRKELSTGKDYANQNAGAKGLAKTFLQKNNPDSAARYALYSYEMNDSLYAQMATDEMARMQAMYDYTRHQEKAQKESRRAEQNANRLRLFIIATMLFVMLAYHIIIKEKNKREAAYEKYLFSLQDLQQAEEELKQLKQHETLFGNLIFEKKKQIKYLEEIVELYEKEQGRKLPSEETMLFMSPILKQIEGKSYRGQGLIEEDFASIEDEIRNHLPGFWEFLSSNRNRLTMHEFQVCMLIRLKLKPKSIGNMLGISAASISKIRINLLFKLFGVKGKPSDFDKRIIKI